MRYTKLLAFAIVSLICSSALAEEHITIDLAKWGAEVRKSMYGIFIEDINCAGDGGLYAEMVPSAMATVCG